MNAINEKKNDKILSISFNQDNSCFSVGLENGFKIYETNPFKKQYKRTMDGGIKQAEMIAKN